MAGHSQFKNIMYRKGAQDAKKAKFNGTWGPVIDIVHTDKNSDKVPNGVYRKISNNPYKVAEKNINNAKNLRVGMTKARVLEIMGEPVKDEAFNQPDVWYYYIETRWHDGQVTEDECMPLVFKQGKLAGWGKDYYAREKLERNRYVQPVIEGLK